MLDDALTRKEAGTPPPAPPHQGEGRAWQDYVVPQRWEAFTADDHAVWDLLFARQVELLGSRVVTPFFDGIDLLKLSHPGVPDVEALNAILTPRTGWTTVAVPGLVPDDIFFAMLSERVFPVGNFIRTRDQLDYLEAPDCFHDMFGHIPMLAHHDFAEMAEHIGRLGTAAIAAGEGHRAARLYWHSVEFGLAKEAGELKILGAGLASSFGESHFSLESDAVERLPFTVGRAVHTPYRHDAFQPRYLVSESLEATIAWVLALTPEGLMSLERSLRAKRSNPAAEVDCFVAFAPRNDAGDCYSPPMADQPTPQEYRSGHDPRTLRDALGCFATGVTVVTCLGADGAPAGLTVNSFTSVSLDPPLLLVCLAKSAASATPLTEASHFAVNVLQTGQQPASIRFSTRDEDRFGTTPWSCGEAGAPILKDSLGVFECERHALHDGGDHHILIGHVIKASFDVGLDPLLYFRGRYRRLHFD